MLDGDVHGSLDGVLEQLRRLKDPDLRPLAREIAETLVEGNREGLLAGSDADGDAMAELADSTYGRGDRGGLGPPTIPRFSGSRLIDRFRARVEPNASGRGSVVRAGWDDAPEVKYLRSGTRHMPARNPVGIRPATRAEIQQLVNDLARRLSLEH